MHWRGAALAGLLVFACSAAAADDQPFLTLDTTDIEPQLAHEFEQDIDWTVGPRVASGVGFESELEYGLFDDLQIAGAVDYGWSHSGSGASALRLDDVGGEAIYRFWNVDFDPVGLGVLASGSLGPDERELEFKLLLQKNFLNDRLRVVLNGGWTGDRERNDEPSEPAWGSDSSLQWSVGIAYSITWELSACLEFNSDRDFEGLLLDGRGTPGASDYFVGPTVQYIAAPYKVSFGVQAQLPWATGGAPGDVHNGFAADEERYRLGLRLTRSF